MPYLNNNFSNLSFSVASENVTSMKIIFVYKNNPWVNFKKCEKLLVLLYFGCTCS